jgi:hypothetical protein
VKRFLCHCSIVILGLLSAIGLLAISISMGRVFWFGFLISVAVLIVAIVRQRTYKSALFLTYAVSLLVGTLVFTLGLLILVIMALRSFT